ncbi:AAA family ATPase [Enterococcus sp. LJL98]
MKKHLILLAGSPGTGKTYLINQLKQTFPQMFVITPDEAKEYYAESVGFNDLNEKKQLEDSKVWPFYYQVLSLYMDAGKRLIVSEYPFSDKQKGRLSEMAQKYDYEVITIRLVGDFETLWQRRYHRDRAMDRHLSFIMTRYHYGDVLENRELATNHITKEAFRQIITDRQYDNFELGTLYEIDVTDFSKVDYGPLTEALKERIDFA